MLGPRAVSGLLLLATSSAAAFNLSPAGCGPVLPSQASQRRKLIPPTMFVPISTPALQRNLYLRADRRLGPLEATPPGGGTLGAFCSSRKEKRGAMHGLGFTSPTLGYMRGSQRDIQLVTRSRNSVAGAIRAEGRGGGSDEKGADEKLPAGLFQICLAVFVQMLGEGIAISTIPLHLVSFGATPVQVGMATSAFSIAQMICCPLIVSLSTRIGRTVVLRGCLAGATLASCLIALSPTTLGIILARGLAGVFAASVPVAQAGVTDIVRKGQSAEALSRVATASQLGIVVGPAASALLASAFSSLGVPAHLQVRAVFAISGIFALIVLALQKPPESAAPAETAAAGAKGGAVAATKSGAVAFPAALRMAQPLLRTIALVVGWSLTLSVSTYCLFGDAILSWKQPQLSASFSLGASITVITQLLIFPRLVKRVGEHLSCSLGLGGVAVGLAGCSLIHAQPLHSALYLVNRVGSGIADTATATLVALASSGREARSRNLALIQSTRAGARVVTPLISGYLFTLSLPTAAPGALPYLLVASLAVALTPLPLLLNKWLAPAPGSDASQRPPAQ